MPQTAPTVAASAITAMSIQASSIRRFWQEEGVVKQLPSDGPATCYPYSGICIYTQMPLYG